MRPILKKSTLLDDVLAYPKQRGPRCSVCLLPADVLAELNAVLATHGACHAALAAALAKRGHHTSKQRIGHHYREGHHRGA